MSDAAHKHFGQNLTILAVDDEPLNLNIMSETLTDEGYEVICASNGKEGLQVLSQAPEKVDIILLDRMMPEMDGMEMLKIIKSDPKYQDIPVIMQTASAASHQFIEGIDAGAYHYLTKPYTDETLLAIVNSTARVVRNSHSLVEELKKEVLALDVMTSCEFKFKTIEDGKKIAIYLSKLFQNLDQKRLAFAVSELIINAIEHGNLEIGFNQKSVLLQQSKTAWQDEIKLRQSLQNYADRYVFVRYEKQDNDFVITIKDQGKGFEWKPYLKLSPDRATANHGRGIAISNLIFDKLEYEGTGNKVICTIKANGDKSRK